MGGLVPCSVTKSTHPLGMLAGAQDLASPKTPGAALAHHAIDSNGSAFAGKLAQAGDGAPAAAKPEPNLMKHLFARYYAPFLAKWYGKVSDTLSRTSVSTAPSRAPFQTAFMQSQLPNDTLPCWLSLC